MFLLNATWHVRDHKFHEYKRRIHQGTEKAAVRAQNRMVARAREVAHERFRTGKMEAGIRGRVQITERGVVVALEDPVWYAHFQDRGTKRGVSALLFLELGLAAGKELIIPELAEEIRAPL